MSALLANPALQPPALSHVAQLLANALPAEETKIKTAPQKLPAGVVDALVGSLATVKGDARHQVEDCLVRYGHITLPAVLAGLLNDNAIVRSRCAFVVIRMGVMAKPAFAQWVAAQTEADLATIQPIITLVGEQVDGLRASTTVCSPVV